MKTSARYFFCALFLVHPIGRAALARDLIATSGAVPPRVQVEIVFDGVPVSSSIEASAIEEATRIWAEHGVAINTLKARRCRREDAVRLTVTFAAGPDRRLASGALGSIRFTDGVPEPAITMYPDAVAAIVASTRFGDDRFSHVVFHEYMLGRVLGRALAHEVGHFLLRSRMHSAAGLMRASHPALDLVAPDRRQFGLSADEVTRLVSVAPITLHASTLAPQAAAP